MMVFTGAALILVISSSAFASKTSNIVITLSHSIYIILPQEIHKLMIFNVLSNPESTWKYGDSDRAHGSK